jgi:hypothetical protein
MYIPGLKGNTKCRMKSGLYVVGYSPPSLCGRRTEGGDENEILGSDIRGHPSYFDTVRYGIRGHCRRNTCYRVADSGSLSDYSGILRVDGIKNGETKWREKKAKARNV